MAEFATLLAMAYVRFRMNDRATTPITPTPPSRCTPVKEFSSGSLQLDLLPAGSVNDSQPLAGGSL